ncbi:MAG TPA: hypothetical protein VMY76_02465 [Gemmatimonadales bacterium]|nr:hypothetical protein [Gemmatimonadales bacterium]
MRLWTSAAAAALVLSAVACRDRDADRDDTASRVDSAVSDVGQDVREGATDVREGVREGARELKSYTWAERSEFRRDVDRRLTDIDGQIEQLANDAKSSGATISDQAMGDIRAARKTVGRNLARLDDATEDGWSDLRGGLDRSLEALRNRIDEVTRTGGPMGGRSAGQS